MALLPSEMPALPSVSNESIWMPVRSVHPITGPHNLPTLTTEPQVAFTRGVLPVEGDWVDGIWEGGTWTNPEDGLAYYLLRVEVGPNGLKVLAPGRYQVWVRFTTPDDKPVVGPERLKVI